jgi:hypothetical protein
LLLERQTNYELLWGFHLFGTFMANAGCHERLDNLISFCKALSLGKASEIFGAGCGRRNEGDQVGVSVSGSTPERKPWEKQLMKMFLEQQRD